MAAFLDATPRKNKHRATLLALLALLALSAYTIIFDAPSLAPLSLRPAAAVAHSPPHQQDRRPSSQSMRIAAAASRPPAPPRPQIKLSPPQELAAIASFIASLPANIIPGHIDPTEPIDPQLVLDFDTRSAHAREELAEIVYDVWLRNPVVLFSRLHSPQGREVKYMLDMMNLRPAPTIFEVDQRADADVLEPLLFRLTGASTLPLLLVGGIPVHADDMDGLRAADASGELRALVTSAGAIVDGTKRSKKKHH